MFLSNGRITPIANKTMIAMGNHDTDHSIKLKDYMDIFGVKGQYLMLLPTQYEGFGFLNVDLINDGTIKYQFTITK